MCSELQRIRNLCGRNLKSSFWCVSRDKLILARLATKRGLRIINNNTG
jgi:hypothetical protein